MNKVTTHLANKNKHGTGAIMAREATDFYVERNKPADTFFAYLIVFVLPLLLVATVCPHPLPPPLCSPDKKIIISAMYSKEAAVVTYYYYFLQTPPLFSIGLYWFGNQ